MCSMLDIFATLIGPFLCRCPDSNKPLGLMLLNGLTKLINEYKEVDPACTHNFHATLCTILYHSHSYPLPLLVF